MNSEELTEGENFILYDFYAKVKTLAQQLPSGESDSAYWINKHGE